ncbi:MAG: hypothetical protein AAF253_09655 [Pseudomonadota bacterium]
MAIRNMMFAGLAAIAIGACGGNDTDTANGTPPAASAEEASAPVTETAAVEQLELHKLDCGTIEISDLDVFSTAGDYAGQSDTFVNTCWLVRHPEGLGNATQRSCGIITRSAFHSHMFISLLLVLSG